MIKKLYYNDNCFKTLYNNFPTVEIVKSNLSLHRTLFRLRKKY